MKSYYRRAWGQATLIAATATMLSLLLSIIMGKGLFDPSRGLASPAAPTTPGSTFLTLGDAQRLQASRQALFIDARNPRDYSAGHIAGAINLPFHNLREDHPLLSALRKEQLLIVYCDGEDCNSSMKLAKLLYDVGFTRVKVFFGGWNDWHTHDLPKEP